MAIQELPSGVEPFIRRVLDRDAGFLDIVPIVEDLNNQQLGREIKVKIRSGGKELRLSAGIILPISADNSEHVILLSNDRMVLIKAYGNEEDIAKYKQHFSPNNTPLNWVSSVERGIDYVEETFSDNLFMFPIETRATLIVHEHPKTLSRAINAARGIKQGRSNKNNL